MASLIRIYLPDPQWREDDIDGFKDETSMWAWSARTKPTGKPYVEDEPWFYALCDEAHDSMMGREYTIHYGDDKGSFYVELENAGVATLFKLKWG